jgi:quercetin dioxygenase-like cupin family protein
MTGCGLTDDAAYSSVAGPGKQIFMKCINLVENWKFDDKGPYAEDVHVDRKGRAILLTLQPEQTIRAHNVPSSPFFVLVLSGQGVFTGAEGLEQAVDSNTLLVFEPGAQHSVRAFTNLVFIGFLHGAPGAQE